MGTGASDMGTGPVLEGLETGSKPSKLISERFEVGGWTEEEIRTAEAGGYVPITLGTNTLRAEAVPTVALSVLRFMWSDF